MPRVRSYLMFYPTEEIDEARRILGPKVHDDQMNKAVELCARIATDVDWPLPYTAVRLSEIMIDKPEQRVVIALYGLCPDCQGPNPAPGLFHQCPVDRSVT